MLNNRTDISIIICTYNRCESLKDTLDSLLMMENNMIIEYEVIVVDNNSKDKTEKVIKNYIPRFNGRLRYIFESNKGLSYARNKGVQEAKGEIIAFTDDDVIIDKFWLLNIYKCFRNYNCDGSCGRVMPLYPNKTPKWIKENRDVLEGPIIRYDYGEGIKIYNNKAMKPAIGANMAFKKTCFSKYGTFRNDLGPGSGAMGDDTEFFKRLIRNNDNLYYCGDALVWHKVEAKRTTYRYIAQWNFKFGRYLARVKENKYKSCFGIPRYIFKLILQDLKFLVFNKSNNPKFIINLLSLFINFGKAYEYFMNAKNNVGKKPIINYFLK